VLAEIGADMNQFPDEDQLSSWAGMCPGNNETGGKRKSGKTTKGSKWLRATLGEIAWAASRTKGTYLSAHYRRIARRRGKKRAIIAVGHTMLVIIYHMIKNRLPYNELGDDYFDKMDKEKLTKIMVNRLEKLGYKVDLTIGEEQKAA
jgi:transposase